ncbi:hypothetical protein Tco_0250643 [Tanacetum coccineum]
MDSIIPLGQNNTLAEYMILSGADNRPPMLDKDLYDSWKKNGVTRTNKYAGLSAAEKIQADCDMKATNIILQGFVVPIFSLRDDPIACLNKEMAFLTAVASSRGDKVKVILVLGIRVMLLVLGETMQVDRQGLLNAATIKVKDIWLGNALNLSYQGMQHDPGVPNGQVVQTIIPNNAAFQTEDLDTYDSDCDDISNAKAVLMANISNYGSDVISEANVQDTNLQAQQDSMILSVIEQMSKQMINHINNWEKANKE